MYFQPYQLILYRLFMWTGVENKLSLLDYLLRRTVSKRQYPTYYYTLKHMYDSFYPDDLALSRHSSEFIKERRRINRVKK